MLDLWCAVAALAPFAEDRSTAAFKYPPVPPHGVKLAIAVKYGSGAPTELAPIGDIAVSTSRAMTMVSSTPGVKTESMLFAARYVPVPENLGMYGCDEAGRIWIRWALCSKQPLNAHKLNVPVPLPAAEKPQSYLDRYAESKAAELQELYEQSLKAEDVNEVNRQALVAASDDGGVGVSKVDAQNTARSSARVMAAMVVGRARQSMLLKKLRSLKASADAVLDRGLSDNSGTDAGETEDDELLDSDSERDVHSYDEDNDASYSDSDGSGSDSNSITDKRQGREKSLVRAHDVSDVDSEPSSMGSKSTYRGSEDSGDFC